jgi:hypothetical protein
LFWAKDISGFSKNDKNPKINFTNYEKEGK